MIIHAYLYALLYAIYEAREDHDEIAAHNPIPHGFLFWVRRALTFAAPVALFYVIQWDFWGLAAALIGGGAMFAAVHRYTLNTLRGHGPNYISASNGYDRAWMWALGKRAAPAMYAAEIIVFNAVTYL